MGIYVHEGVAGQFLHLRELITGTRIKAICGSGYLGQAGEIWYTRLMPPLDDIAACDYSVVFTTPYVLGKGPNPGGFVGAPESDWLDYFDRNLGRIEADSEAQAYETLMKYGFDRYYWNEYVFLAYRNYRHDMIYLDGVPDIIASLPHGELARTG